MKVRIYYIITVLLVLVCKIFFHKVNATICARFYCRLDFDMTPAVCECQNKSWTASRSHTYTAVLCFKAQNTHSIPTYMAGAFAIGTKSQIINTAVM